MRIHSENPHAATARKQIWAAVMPFTFWVLIAHIPFAALAKSKIRNVLILHSYHKGYLWTDEISSGIEKSF